MSGKDQLKIEENGDNSHQRKDKAEKSGLLLIYSVLSFSPKRHRRDRLRFSPGLRRSLVEAAGIEKERV